MLRSKEDILRNVHASKYSWREQVKRLFWGVGIVMFRMSPRPCFAWRSMLLRLFGAKIGVGLRTYPTTYIYFPWNLELGDYVSLGEWSLIYNLGKVKIGNRVTVSQRAHLCAGTHDYHDPAMPLLKPPIVVGDDVWICADAFIGPEVVVGESAVVAARAVVIRAVEPLTVVAGNPAKWVKRIEA